MEVDNGLWQEDGSNISIQYWIMVSGRCNDDKLLLSHVQCDFVYVASGSPSRLPLISTWTEKIVSVSNDFLY